MFKKILISSFLVFFGGQICLAYSSYAPYFEYIKNYTVNEEEEVIFLVEADDPDRNDLFFNFYDRPESSYYPLPPHHNAVLVNTDDEFIKEFHWTPEIGWRGTYEVRFEVNDEFNFDYEDVKITVEGDNNPPVIDEMEDREVVIGDILSFMVPVTHPDIHDDLTFTASWKRGGSYSSMPFEIDFDTGLGKVVWETAYGVTASGDYEFKFCATDGPERDCGNMNVTVKTNHPPEMILSTSAPQVVEVGNEMTIVMLASDVEDGESLIYEVYEGVLAEGELPDGAKVDGQTFTWTPTQDQMGEYVFNFYVTDSDGDEVMDSVEVNVVETVEEAADVVEIEDSEEAEAVEEAEDAEEDMEVEEEESAFSGFPDIEEERLYFDAIEFVGEQGIFEGNGVEGAFYPDRLINRVETAKVVLKTFDFEIIAAPDDDFGYSDLIIGEWYMDFVYTAYLEGVLVGGPDGLMRPADYVNKVELLKIVLEAAEVSLTDCSEKLYMDVTPDDWFCKYVLYANENEIMDVEGSGYFDPADEMTRAEVAEVLYLYLSSI